jgi:hypothetical protein
MICPKIDRAASGIVWRETINRKKGDCKTFFHCAHLSLVRKIEGASGHWPSRRSFGVSPSALWAECDCSVTVC